LLSKYINPKYLQPSTFTDLYKSGVPFPHVCLDDFFKEEVLTEIAAEFPDLSSLSNPLNFNNSREIKLASRGMNDLGDKCFNFISFLNSDVFLQYIQTLSGLEEKLISDPYLSGGGYHEIKKGGLLKVHADFNKHPFLDLHRRLNFIVYLNKDWEPTWGGELQLFEKDMSGPVQKIEPHFNRVVVFTTNSETYHGHPDPLDCPEDRSRRSIALYYFSTSRPSSEIVETHSTIFKERPGESFLSGLRLRNTFAKYVPESLKKIIR
jgi:hypothetical protein